MKSYTYSQKTESDALNKTSTILSIDCGTQSIRVLLFSPTGELIDKEQVLYEPYISSRPGWAEQDPEIFWQGLCKASLALKERNSELYHSIEGVGVTAQRDSMVNIDESGRVLRPVITWLDQRKAKPLYQPNPFMKVAFSLAGMNEAIIKIQCDAKCNWIRQHQPDIWRRTHKYLQISGFLNHRLTGQFIDSVASQIGHIPFDYKSMKWAKSGSLNMRVCPVEKEKLPELALPGEVIGSISKEAAIMTGINAGTPVVACGSDKGCETIGMGILNSSMASLSFGTTATVQTTTKQYCEPLKFMPAYPAPIPDHYNPEVEIFRGFWMITWFKNEFAHKEIEAASERGVSPEVLMNEMLAKSPPGSMGLMVQPYWGPGLKTPSAKGAMVGFGDVHKKAHVYRAVVEGLCYGLLDGLKKIEKACGSTTKMLAVSGGASQSDEICQITADVFNRLVLRGKTCEASGLGAAIVTAKGVNIHNSFESAIKAMVFYQHRYNPNSANAALYDKIFNRVYTKLYPSLEKVYEEIRDITGYPEKI
ncbi:MAG: FGGY-family carbohydrate kinase [Desulfamplus sp.]|nr:FGGY-family carbohydrate kinase [Desulfamplus sp.]